MTQHVVGETDGSFVARGALATHHHATRLQRAFLGNLLVCVPAAGNQRGRHELQADVGLRQFLLSHEAWL